MLMDRYLTGDTLYEVEHFSRLLFDGMDNPGDLVTIMLTASGAIQGISSASL